MVGVSKLEWIRDRISDYSAHFLAMLAAVAANELRKIFFAFTLSVLGLNRKGEMEMEKPYDLKDLMGRLKGKGLDLTEEAAKLVLHETCVWIQESAALSPNKLDDLAAVGVPELEKLALKLVDKIDGQEG